MARKKSEGRETLWRGILRRQAESSLSIRRFCAAEGVSEPSFYAWRKKLRERRHDGTRVRQSRGREEVVSDDAPDAAAQIAQLEELLARGQETIAEQEQTIENLAADNALLKRSLFGSRRERFQTHTANGKRFLSEAAGTRGRGDGKHRPLDFAAFGAC